MAGAKEQGRSKDRRKTKETVFQIMHDKGLSTIGAYLFGNPQSICQ